MSPPCATVEDILSRLELRNVTLTTQWLNFQNEITATKETLVKWETLTKESHKVIIKFYDCFLFNLIVSCVKKIKNRCNSC